MSSLPGDFIEGNADSIIWGAQGIRLGIHRYSTSLVTRSIRRYSILGGVYVYCTLVANTLHAQYTDAAHH